LLPLGEGFLHLAAEEDRVLATNPAVICLAERRTSGAERETRSQSKHPYPRQSLSSRDTTPRPDPANEDDKLSKLQIHIDSRVGFAISTRKSAPVAEVKKNLSE
jgi:hypothetical protein